LDALRRVQIVTRSLPLNLNNEQTRLSSYAHVRASRESLHQSTVQLQFFLGYAPGLNALGNAGPQLPQQKQQLNEHTLFILDWVEKEKSGFVLTVQPEVFK